MTGPYEQGHELTEPDGLPQGPRRTEKFTDFLAQNMDEFIRMAIGRLRNLHDADEAVMDAALKMNLEWTVIEAHPNPLALARAIVRTSCIDYYRRRARLAAHEVPVEMTGLSRTPTGDDLLELRGYDRLDRARACLEERSPKQAECVRLKYIEGMTTDEIADCLDITKGAAKVNIHLGIKALHALLDLPEPGKGIPDARRNPARRSAGAPRHAQHPRQDRLPAPARHAHRAAGRPLGYASEQHLPWPISLAAEQSPGITQEIADSNELRTFMARDHLPKELLPTPFAHH
ncbi:sigma-70 family RNA polymerase sigma factor (plasmid) [Streptomyces sp. NBC_00440]|uniref:RNA polymerase sigma factor n=1 Tax=Streptomyces sp. NBC_00440 TaxID=2975741 RepID=UPI002E1CCF4A